MHMRATGAQKKADKIVRTDAHPSSIGCTLLDIGDLCSYYVLMGKVIWTRWGRGNCEGYGLEIGSALRASVVCNKDGVWVASINAVGHGSFKTKEAAIRRIEEAIRDDVGLVLEDWDLWNNAQKRAP